MRDVIAMLSSMRASLTIRKLDERVKARLGVRAARHGRSMEAEAREILKSALVAEEPQAQNLAQAIRRHVEPLGGVELTLAQRQPVGARRYETVFWKQVLT
jgi:plasmid stability protein